MKVGSLVELINDNWCYTNGAKKHPVKNKIYTVRGVFTSLPSKFPSILLEEIINPKLDYRVNNRIYYGFEPTFKMERFRELLPPMEISIENILEKELV